VTGKLTGRSNEPRHIIENRPDDLFEGQRRRGRPRTFPYRQIGYGLIDPRGVYQIRFGAARNFVPRPWSEVYADVHRTIRYLYGAPEFVSNIFQQFSADGACTIVVFSLIVYDKLFYRTPSADIETIFPINLPADCNTAGPEKFDTNRRNIPRHWCVYNTNRRRRRDRF